MPEFVVMFPADNEKEWASKTEEERQETFEIDYKFSQLLAARGGVVTGGAGLTPSSQARTIRRASGSQPLVTEGPYAEAVEQMSGFFIVTCKDYDELVDAAQVLVRAHPAVEIRPFETF